MVSSTGVWASELPNYFTGIEDKNLKVKKSLVEAIYPNPTSGYFRILFAPVPVKKAIVKIFDTDGKLVYTKNIQGKTSEDFDLKSYPKGIYIVRVISDKNAWAAKVSLQ